MPVSSVPRTEKTAAVRDREDGGFGMMGAVVVSVVLHLLLVLLMPLVPAGTGAVPFESPADERHITFTFTDAPADDKNDQPAQDLPPAPTEMPPLAEPDFEASGDPLLEVSRRPLPVPETLPVDRIAPVQPSEAEAEPLDDDGGSYPQPDVQSVPDADLFASEHAGDRQSTGRREPTIDVAQALRDYSRSALRRPRSGDPSRGSNKNVFVPDLSAVPSTGFGMGNLHFESGDYDWTNYARQIYWAIWRAWHNRLWATTDEFEGWAHKTRTWMLEHQAQVRFTIEDTGQVTGIAVELPSGCPPLDDASTDALAEVVLPPLPDDFPRAQETVHVRFIAIGPVRALRPVLGRMRAAGLFGTTRVDLGR